MGLPCFVGHGGRGGSVGDTCMPMARRLLSDVCGYAVSPIESVDVRSKGDVLRLPSLAHHLVFPNVWGLATLTKFNTEMRICRTKFSIVTLILQREKLEAVEKIKYLVSTIINDGSKSEILTRTSRLLRKLS